MTIVFRVSVEVKPSRPEPLPLPSLSPDFDDEESFAMVPCKGPSPRNARPGAYDEIGRYPNE